jgi:hypothetical protein
MPVRETQKDYQQNYACHRHYLTHKFSQKDKRLFWQKLKTELSLQERSINMQSDSS